MNTPLGPPIPGKDYDEPKAATLTKEQRDEAADWLAGIEEHEAGYDWACTWGPNLLADLDSKDAEIARLTEEREAILALSTTRYEKAVEWQRERDEAFAHGERDLNLMTEIIKERDEALKCVETQKQWLLDRGREIEVLHINLADREQDVRAWKDLQAQTSAIGGELLKKSNEVLADNGRIMILLNEAEDRIGKLRYIAELTAAAWRSGMMRVAPPALITALGELGLLSGETVIKVEKP